MGTRDAGDITPEIHLKERLEMRRALVTTVEIDTRAGKAPFH